MAIKEGWTGRVYEDFEVGDIYPHPLGRTVLPVDNSWFTLLTQNTNPIHFDRAYSAQTEFGPAAGRFHLYARTGHRSVSDRFVDQCHGEPRVG
jgi:acyl dehydratase